MSIIDSGPAQLTPPKHKEDEHKLRKFLASLDDTDVNDSDNVDYESPETTMWNCLETHGYKKTKSAFQHIEKQLITESKNLLGELGKVVLKNKTLNRKWQAFNKKIGEPTTIYWKSLPVKQSEKTEDKPEDILDQIRQRQNKTTELE